MTKDAVTKFKTLIARAGHSQRSIAELIGINQSIVSHMFRGRREMPVKEIKLWAQALNVEEIEIYKLVSEEGPQYEPTDEHVYGNVSKRFQHSEACKICDGKGSIDGSHFDWFDCTACNGTGTVPKDSQ